MDEGWYRKQSCQVVIQGDGFRVSSGIRRPYVIESAAAEMSREEIVDEVMVISKQAIRRDSHIRTHWQVSPGW